MSSTPRFPAFLAVMAFACASLAPPAYAQDLEYKSATSIKFEGALGKVMNIAAKLGGGSGKTLETTYIKDQKMRTDLDKTSSIVDLEKGRFITIDHANKMYTAVTLQQMVQAMEAQMAQAKAQAKADASAEKRPADEPKGEVDFKFDLKVDATGEK